MDPKLCLYMITEELVDSFLFNMTVKYQVNCEIVFVIELTWESGLLE